MVGSDLDGPEWLSQPYTNMFNVEGTSSPKYPSYTNYGAFWKSLGVKKISVVASDSPSSISAANQEKNSIKAVGLSTCDNQVVPLGGADFTSYALSFKNAGCDAAECSCLLSSSLAMASALRQAGETSIKIDFAAGPSQGVYASPEDLSAAANVYFPGATFDPSFSDAASKTFLANLKKYDPSYKGGIPDLGVIDGYLSADLTIKGLEVTGSNLSRPSFISSLRKVTNYNVGGMGAAPVSFNNFGVAPPKVCFRYAQFVNKKYEPYPASGTAFCGSLIPNSNVG